MALKRSPRAIDKLSPYLEEAFKRFARRLANLEAVFLFIRPLPAALAS